MATSTYMQTAIQVLSTTAALNGLFLNVPAQGALPNDLLAGTVSTQVEGTLFNVPFSNNSATTFPGWEAVGSPSGPSGNSSDLYVAHIDLLSHYQPVLFSRQAHINQEPNTAALFCNVFPANGGPPDTFLCQTPPGAPFSYFGHWAICEFDDYGDGDLFLYDAAFYNNTAPPQCTTVTLKVIAAPDSTPNT